MKQKAVFLDRDVTINKVVGYPNSFSVIVVYPYSIEAFRKLNESGFLAVIVTNQSGIGRGLIVEKNLQDIHQKISDLFARQKAHFDGIYYCPHYLFSPDPGYRDKVEDVLFGLNIEAKPILCLTGFGRESLPKLKEKGITPAYVAETLLDAVNWILQEEKK